jgi:DNA-binding transcriptional MerR regulator
VVEDNWLSVSDVSEKVGIPVETIRRYIRSHGVHLKVKKVHKRYVVHNDSVTVIKQIRELYADGKNVDEVEQTLSNRGIPMTVTVKMDNDYSMTVSVADELKRMNERLEEQQNFNKQQSEFNRLLIEKLENQERYIKDSLEKRDQVLIESLRESAAAREGEKKKGFWARLFGGN